MNPLTRPTKINVQQQYPPTHKKKATATTTTTTQKTTAVTRTHDPSQKSEAKQKKAPQGRRRVPFAPRTPGCSRDTTGSFLPRSAARSDRRPFDKKDKNKKKHASAQKTARPPKKCTTTYPRVLHVDHMIDAG